MKILFNTNYNNYNTNFKGISTDISKEILQGLVNQGCNANDIAKIYGKSPTWGVNRMKAYGLQSLHMQNMQKLRASIKDLLLSGKNMNEIAEEFHVSPRTVQYTAVLIIGKENLKEIKKEGAKNRVRQEAEKLRPRIVNNEDTSDFYDESLKRYRQEIKHAEVEMRKEIRTENNQIIANQILDLVRKGRNVSQAIRELNMKSTVVAYVDKDALKEAREEGKQYKFNKIRDYVRQGYQVRQIAKEMGCSEEKIYKIMGKEYRANWQKERMQNRIKDILKYKSEGLTNDEIAEKMHISTITIQRALQNIEG